LDFKHYVFPNGSTLTINDDNSMTVSTHCRKDIDLPRRFAAVPNGMARLDETERHRPLCHRDRDPPDEFRRCIGDLCGETAHGHQLQHCFLRHGHPQRHCDGDPDNTGADLKGRLAMATGGTMPGGTAVSPRPAGWGSFPDPDPAQGDEPRPATLATRAIGNAGAGQQPLARVRAVRAPFHRRAHGGSRYHPYQAVSPGAAYCDGDSARNPGGRGPALASYENGQVPMTLRPFAHALRDCRRAPGDQRGDGRGCRPRIGGSDQPAQLIEATACHPRRSYLPRANPTA